MQNILKTSITALILFSATAFAADIDSKCKNNEAVLFHKMRSASKSEKVVIADSLSLEVSKDRFLVGKLDYRKEEVVSCKNATKVCEAIKRGAKKIKFNHDERSRFINNARIHHFSCSVNAIVKALNLPSDPLFSRQRKDFNQLKLREVYAKNYTGSQNVFVPVVDTGVDFNHPDLLGNVRADLGANFVDRSATPFDDNSHGTHVAGIIGARRDNGMGIAGVAAEVSIIPFKFLDSRGSGDIAGAAEAFQQIVNLKNQGYNIKFVNSSWGGYEYSEALREAITYLGNNGILLVAAAGNDGIDNDVQPMYPASFDNSNIISVAAVDSADSTLAWFTNYGARTVDTAAPGVDILSTVPGGGYEVLSGTSMAAPFVSGALTLLQAKEPNLSSDAMRNRMLSREQFPEWHVDDYLDRDITGVVDIQSMLNVRTNTKKRRSLIIRRR